MTVPETPDSYREEHWRQALWILAVATVLRFALAAAVPLFADETYYWEWSRRLAGGYFDHPPMIAVLIAGGTAILGDSVMGVRLLPILAGTFAGFWIVRTTCHLAGPTAARFAAVMFSVLPLSAAGLVLATPDAPLLAALAWTLYAVVRALDDGAPVTYWLLAGLAIGVAMASKFTGVFYPMAITLALILHPGARRQLATPGPWLAVAVASLVMVPVLYWNATHDWIAFRFQIGHGLGTTARGSWWQRELDMIGGQAGLVTPILFFLLLGAIHRAYTPRGNATRFVLAQIAVFSLAFFVYSATRKSVEANWPAIAWLPAMILLASALPGLRTAWERRGVWLAGALTALALSHVVVPWLPIPARRDPVARAYGWDAVGAAVDSARAALGSANSPGTLYAELGEAEDPRGRAELWVATNRYQDASLVAFHTADKAEVFALNLGSRRNQYDLWPRFSQRAARGATMLLVLEEPAEGPPVSIRWLVDHFAAVDSGPLISLERDGEQLTRRRLWVLSGWAGTWPADSTDPLVNR